VLGRFIRAKILGCFVWRFLVVSREEQIKNEGKRSPLEDRSSECAMGAGE
jgi:hypothetical protein